MVTVEIKHLTGCVQAFIHHRDSEEFQVSGPREWKEVLESQLENTKYIQKKPREISKYVCNGSGIIHDCYLLSMVISGDPHNLSLVAEKFGFKKI